MRTLTVKADVPGLDLEKVVPFPHGADKYALVNELLSEIDEEWGGMVEEYEVVVSESMEKGLTRHETDRLNDYHNR